jgi:hypothetical protein
MTPRRGPGLRRQHYRSPWPINTAPGVRQQPTPFLSDAGQPPKRCHRRVTFSGQRRECSALNDVSFAQLVAYEEAFTTLVEDLPAPQHKFRTIAAEPVARPSPS